MRPDSIVHPSTGRSAMVSAVELRRALLLFAIVLGLAAIVAALSNTRSGHSDTTAALPAPRPATARPAPARQGTIRFDAGGPAATHFARVDESVTVDVKVDEAGTVELQGLGLSADAEPLTPARFDVLASQPGKHAVLLIPPNGVRARTVGHIVVRPQR
jgi:hypothetical protein